MHIFAKTLIILLQLLEFESKNKKNVKKYLNDIINIGAEMYRG